MGSGSDEIEWIDTTGDSAEVVPKPESRRGPLAITFALLLVITAVIVAIGATTRDEPETHMEPLSAVSARQLFHDVGGLDGLTLGTAAGAFDLVRFDPEDANTLIASKRSSYGTAENQDSTEIWRLDPNGDMSQTLWDPQTPHDFVHFNVDGTATMWVHGGGPGFAPRRAVQLDNDLNPDFTSDPMYASRFVVVGGSVFALTGDSDYYSQETAYQELVVDSGDGLSILDDGTLFSWIDAPLPDIVVAYPINANGVTAVWDVANLVRLPDHELANWRYRRLAVSGDRSTAVGLTFAGDVQVVDLATRSVQRVLGRVDAQGVDQPLTLSSNGDALITVEQTGDVTIWWTREEAEPIASFTGAAAQPRWLSERYAPTSASAVAPDASRIALQRAAMPNTPTEWLIVDTDLNSWINRVNN